MVKSSLRLQEYKTTTTIQNTITERGSDPQLARPQPSHRTDELIGPNLPHDAWKNILTASKWFFNENFLKSENRKNNSIGTLLSNKSQQLQRGRQSYVQLEQRIKA